MENKRLFLSEDVVKDIGLSRDQCDIVVISGEFSEVAFCNDERTGYSCRGEGQSDGCFLRHSIPKFSDTKYGIRIDQLDTDSYKIE